MARTTHPSFSSSLTTLRDLKASPTGGGLVGALFFFSYIFCSFLKSSYLRRQNN